MTREETENKVSELLEETMIIVKDYAKSIGAEIGAGLDLWITPGGYCHGWAFDKNGEYIINFSKEEESDE